MRAVYVFTSLIVVVVLVSLTGTAHAHSEYLPALLRQIRPSHIASTQRRRPGRGSSLIVNAFNITGTLLSFPPFTTSFTPHTHTPDRLLLASGTNAECYWSNDGLLLSYQAIPQGTSHPCDQIFTMTPDGGNVTPISPLNGRTTCSYVLNDKTVVYSSTMSFSKMISPACPAGPDMTAGYLWPIYKNMQIYIGGPNGLIHRTLAPSDAYDAESTLSPDGKSIVFTSARDGDLELYTVRLDGTQLRRMTYSPGYDGGAYYSHNGKMLCWRANRPHGADLTDYLNLLRLGLVEPVGMQLYVMDIDNPDSARLVAPLNGTNFAPSFLPDDSGLIFSSNMHDPQGGSFQLYTINLDGTNLTQVTTEADWGVFNAFPMFGGLDKLTLLWASSAGITEMGPINIWRGHVQGINGPRKNTF